MAKFKIATPKGASFTVAGGGYDLEMEPLDGIDAEIVEGPTDEDGFIKFCQDADAIYAKGIRFTKKIIDGLPSRVRAIVLGSVGVDSVDVKAVHRARHPGDQLPRYLHRGSRRPRDDAAAVNVPPRDRAGSGWCVRGSGAKGGRRCCKFRG